MNRLASALAFSSALVATAAHAQALPPEPPAPPSDAGTVQPAVHQHLGFFLRLDGGIGYTGTLGVAIGGALSEDFIVAGAVSTIFTKGGVFGTGGSRLSLLGLGLNLTYYLMPVNVYLSLTPSVTALSDSGRWIVASPGFGLKFALGKEWWVGDDWAIGVAAQFMFGTSGTPIRTTQSAGLAFSATYN